MILPSIPLQCAPMYLKISVTINGNELKSYDFDQAEVLIGRDVGCDVRLDNAGVSRKHAKLFMRGDTIEAVDLGSGNGTFVNGQKVDRVVISGRDTVRIGKFTLSCKLTEEGAPAPANSSVEAASELGDASNKTVFLRPHETKKILQQTHAVSQPHRPIQASKSKEQSHSQGYIFAAGAMLGLFFGWLFWY